MRNWESALMEKSLGLLPLLLSAPVTVGCYTSEKNTKLYTIFILSSHQATLNSYPGQCDNHWPDGYETQATHYIQRFYSRSNSYLVIEPVSEEQKCGQTKSINVHYILNNDRVKAGERIEIYFYYIVSILHSKWESPNFFISPFLALKHHWIIKALPTVSISRKYFTKYWNLGNEHIQITSSILFISI